MPSFAKNPKVIASAFIILWIAYILYANFFQLDPVQIHLLPLAATLQLKVSAIVIGSAIFGSVATLIVQWAWRRRHSNPGSASITESGVRSSTAT